MRKMNARYRAGAIVGLAAIALTLPGCATQKEAKDMGGDTEEEALRRPLREQYALAEERHRELNERFAEIQRDIAQEGWTEGALGSEVIPGQGNALSGELRGATRDNSYYFSVHRYLQGGGAPKHRMRECAERWEARGWEMSEYTSEANGEARISATTEDRFWFALDEEGERLKLTGYSPVYWGDNLALVMAIAERRDAEDEAGTVSQPSRREDGTAPREPGDFRSFPAWDSIPSE